MAQQNQVQMPGVFGGLMRYDAEYASNFMLSPVGVVIFIVAVILFVVLLKVFFPVGAFLVLLGLSEGITSWMRDEQCYLD